MDYYGWIVFVHIVSASAFVMTLIIHNPIFLIKIAIAIIAL
jgi:hypothetical protein